MQGVEDQVLQALNAEERATLWTLLAQALQGVDETACTGNAAPLAAAAH